MGGCRCVFQTCENSTYNRPGMHFFHFPTRHKERCERWVQTSNVSCKNITESQLRNKVVCQQHFRDECFMNHIKNKLTKTAVPTIMTLSSGEILEFGNGEGVKDWSRCLPVSDDGSSSNSSVLLNVMMDVNEQEFVPQLTVETILDSSIDQIQDIATDTPADDISPSDGPKLLNAGASSSQIRYLKPLKRLVKKKIPIIIKQESLDVLDLAIASIQDRNSEPDSIVETVDEKSYNADLNEMNIEEPLRIEQLPEYQHLVMQHEAEMNRVVQEHQAVIDGYDQRYNLQLERSLDIEQKLEESERKLQEFDNDERMHNRQIQAQLSTIEQLRSQTKMLIEKLEASMKIIENNKSGLRKSKEYQFEIEAMAAVAASRDTIIEGLRSRIATLECTVTMKDTEIQSQKHTIDRQNEKIQDLTLQIDAQKTAILTLQQQQQQLVTSNAALQSSISEKAAPMSQPYLLDDNEIQSQKHTIDRQNEKIQELTQQIDAQKTEIHTLEKQQQQLVTNAALQSSVSTTSNLPSITQPKNKPEKAAQMSKPHLFNGIRRYLNPSMVALLRMEMFGEAEREYKQDERDLAMELMRLPLDNAQPGSVYDFMRSEWRFRLPPRINVLQWIREREQNAPNVDSDWDDC